MTAGGVAGGGGEAKANRLQVERARAVSQPGETLGRNLALIKLVSLCTHERSDGAFIGMGLPDPETVELQSVQNY